MAMLAPRGEEYVVEILFQGYVEWGVLDHALFELSSADVGGSSSIHVILGSVELTESGGGVEYFTVIDRGGEIDLSGFTLNAVDRETGRPDGATAGIQIIGAVRLVPGQEVSLRRTPDLVDADDDQMVGTFAGG